MMLTSHSNKDSSKDYLDLMSLLLFKQSEDTRVFIRDKGLFGSKRAYIAMPFSRGSDVATFNAYNLAVDILSEKIQLILSTG